MSRNIRINRLDTSNVDLKLIGESYQFFTAECRDYKIREKACDLLLGADNVCSTKNEREGGKLYIMMRRGLGSDRVLSDRMSMDRDVKENCTLFEKDPDELKLKTLLQLMINSLSNPSRSERASNLSGRYFTVVRTVTRNETIKEVITLEFKISEARYFEKDAPELYLSCNVVTFTNTKWKDYMHFTRRRPFESYTQYILKPNGLKPKTDSDTDDSFIIRKSNNKKNNVDFASFLDVESIESTKSYKIDKMMDYFNARFKGMAELSLCRLDIDDTIQTKVSELKELHGHIPGFFKNRKVYVLNHADDAGEELTVWVSEQLNSHGILCERTSQAVMGQLTIEIIHNAEYYIDRGIKDPHGMGIMNTCQHMTVEDMGMNRSALYSSLENLMIKDDLQQKQISIDDWSAYGFSGPLTFIDGIFDDKGNLIRLTNIQISEQGKISCDANLSDDLVLMLHDAFTLDNAEGAIIDDKGNINIISRTDLIAVPDMKLIKDKIKINQKNGAGTTTGLRTVEGRDTYLAECTDINRIDLDDRNSLYYCGLAGGGMDATIHNAANIRHVHATEKSELFFDEMMRLMAVPFVRHEQLTVLPYPFKYLREYSKMEY